MMILATVYFINKYWGVRHWKIIVLFYFIVVAVLFAVFYPVISGMPVSRSWIDGLKWMKGWVF